jgi:hypothetical protein
MNSSSRGGTADKLACPLAYPHHSIPCIHLQATT